MIRRVMSLVRPRGAAPVPEAVSAARCRHCGGSRLKLSYRRRDKAADGDAGTTQTVFILRCAGCEGFTTVSA
jgi:hypothetical protein